MIACTKGKDSGDEEKIATPESPYATTAINEGVLELFIDWRLQAGWISRVRLRANQFNSGEKK